MDITVRLATAEDLVEVRYVGFATWPPTYGTFAGPRFVVQGLDMYWSSEAISAAIGRGDIYVAADGERVLGVSEVDHYEGRFVMWKLYVLPEHQHRGIGGRLVQAVAERARAQREDLYTEYVAGNRPAAEFYLAHGFAPVNTASSASSPLDSVWMRRPIS